MCMNPSLAMLQDWQAYHLHCLLGLGVPFYWQAQVMLMALLVNLPSQEIHLHELEELVMRGLLCGQLLQQHMQEKSFIEQDHQF